MAGNYHEKILHRRDVCNIPENQRSDADRRLLLDNGVAVNCTTIKKEIEAADAPRNNSTVPIVVGVVVGLFLLVVIAVGVYKVRRRWSKKGASEVSVVGGPTAAHGPP